MLSSHKPRSRRTTQILKPLKSDVSRVLPILFKLYTRPRRAHFFTLCANIKCGGDVCSVSLFLHNTKNPPSRVYKSVTKNFAFSPKQIRAPHTAGVFWGHSRKVFQSRSPLKSPIQYTIVNLSWCSYISSILRISFDCGVFVVVVLLLRLVCLFVASIRDLFTVIAAVYFDSMNCLWLIECA